jgi:predicted RND superfamily exporter protein
MRDKILKKLAQFHTNNPKKMLIIVTVITMIFIVLSTQLKVTMRWSDLLPGGDKRTLEFNKIIEEFKTATSIIVVAQGEEKRIKQFADTLAPLLLTAIDSNKNISLIQRVDYKNETEFLKNHGLMLIKESDLKNMKDIFKNPNLTGVLTNINNSMEKEYIGQEESISTREKEDQAVRFLDGIQNFAEYLKRSTEGDILKKEEIEQTVDNLLIGDPYFMSYDKKVLIMNAIPTFSVMDIDILVKGTEIIQEIVNDCLKDFPDVRAGLTGFIPICHDEMVYSEKSLGYTTVIAMIAILILLIISFRMWVAPVFAILNLIIGIIWAVGVTVLVVGQLNIMTQMMAVILMGLGIDFSIHLISGFTERRAAGDSIHKAMEDTFLKSGKGILTGGLTTAFAFMAMVISSSRGMKEMGLVTGAGLLAILVATFLILPIFLVLRERRIQRKQQVKKLHFIQRDISFRFLGWAGELFGKNYIFTIIASILITILLIIFASKITFDQNYMNIEPEGLTSITLQDTILDKYDLGMDYALVTADNPEKSREIAEQYRDMSSVAMVEDISLYLPSTEQQKKRIPHIEEINNFMKAARIQSRISKKTIAEFYQEIERLEMNIMELQDMAFIGGQDKVDSKCKQIVGDPDKTNSKNIIQELNDLIKKNPKKVIKQLSYFQKYFAPYYKNYILKMCSTKPIQFKDLPVSILDRYSNISRTQFLVSVFPAGNIWQNADFLHQFADDLEKISDRATGMPPVFRALIEIIGRDGRNALILTLVIVFLLLWLDFRNPKHALIAMIPLAAGIVWMIGLMRLTGQQFTVMNVMGLPMILGIGIDDGVHIVHRWLSEGKGTLRIIFSSTGKAILLTSLTTMLAFGSLIFSIWRGFGQLGSALFVGVAACFLTTVLILSGIIGFIERDK